MIKVKYGTSTQRNEDVVSEHTVVKDFLDAHNVDYVSSTMFINGAPMSAADYRLTFAQLGVGEDCKITSVVKADCA
jgi:hypothetical protein